MDIILKMTRDNLSLTEEACLLTHDSNSSIHYSVALISLDTFFRLVHRGRNGESGANALDLATGVKSGGWGGASIPTMERRASAATGTSRRSWTAILRQDHHTSYLTFRFPYFAFKSCVRHPFSQPSDWLKLMLTFDQGFGGKNLPNLN